ncbi:MAG: molybdopterin-binding protein [Caldilineaceae bacterium]|nr:molybdopterin-binding protein [Caldilineaceae bacterium]MDE0312714.1 molybdopterin-binding protein [Caldilineaceae bacterium]
MVIRCGFLVIAGPASSDDADEVLAQVQRLAAGVLDGFLPLLSRVYREPPRYQLEETLRQWCDEEELDLILTVGGTFPAPGPSAEEIVPEATAAVLERLMPSLPERMRARAAATDPIALLDRGVAGIRGRTLIINLPGGEALTAAFLENIVNVIPAVMARIGVGDVHPATEDAPPEPEKMKPRSAALDKAEFAEFLRRRQKSG